MSDIQETKDRRLLILPDSAANVLSIRARAIVFRDPRSEDLLRHVDRIARSEASVLIVGETGTGKELIARHLHQESGRTGPFVAVNCGAFSESLIDAELFGHEAGAYTGANHARAGWFEAANGGTLFLDEVGDLPLAHQVKLLRVLQERQIVRLGSRKPIALDVRLVAATNVDLARAIEAQNFRIDLYYRLNVATVDLPPLRERTGDILPLVNHFIDVYAPRLGLVDVVVAPEAESALVNYPWPGNIRELENVVHFALIVCQQRVIRLKDLKLVSVGAAHAVAPTPVATTPTREARSSNAAFDQLLQHQLSATFGDLIDTGAPDLWRQVEERLVRIAFDRGLQNQVRTARLLGITRNTLRTLLKRHGLLAATAADEGALDDAVDDVPETLRTPAQLRPGLDALP